MSERPSTLRGLIFAAREGTIVLSEREEHLIRKHFGYADSEKRTLLQRDEVARRIRSSVEVEVEEADGTVTVTRYADDGTPVEELVGPAGLSLTAFPTQTKGDLTPTEEQRSKLG